MTISYNWLMEYLPQMPEKPGPDELSAILTSIGLEVESMEKFEEVKGGLRDLLVGEVMSCEKHPGADKLKITTVSTGTENLLNIVCGAENVAAGQKVVVAPVGTTIYPIAGEPVKLKKAKIRGVESEGMICAEDEIGISNNHDGILILPPEIPAGTRLAEVYRPYTDHIYEIGLTPNRIDAMSHLGVAKDVCAWLSHHHEKNISAISPYLAYSNLKDSTKSFDIVIENPFACKRYSGALLTGLTVTDSPLWLQQKLKSIGLKPINNIVDITNFILHESGQPLHAFDADRITGNKIIVKNAGKGSVFQTLDDKERLLSTDDLMICNAQEAMCIAGVYGGLHSGITADTKNIFLESAWFNPAVIRKTSLRLELRTDAASRFEKGTDISNTLNVLQRAALLLIKIAGGEIIEISDVYPVAVTKKTVELPYRFLEKLSGKKYPPEQSKNILSSLGFEIIKDDADGIIVEAPYSKPDISLPADLVEEIMRIDGLDNIDIPRSIMISASVDKSQKNNALKEKIAGYLTGFGFYEIFTNSITNSDFYDDDELRCSVRMINSLSAGLDILRPDLLQGGLQAISYNINRKNADLRFFEFGKTYSIPDKNKHSETMHLALYLTGNLTSADWKIKTEKTDYYYLKGVVEALLNLAGITGVSFKPGKKANLRSSAVIYTGNKITGYIGEIDSSHLKRFDIKSPVFFANINWSELLQGIARAVKFNEISKFPPVTRDLSMLVDKTVSYDAVELVAQSQKISELRQVKLFDVFESDKLGVGKKSMALNFFFLNESRTLTDKEIDIFMQRIINGFQETLQAEIRK